MSETNITSANSVPARSFRGIDTRKLEETTEFLRGIDLSKIKNGQLDEDTMDKVKDYVKNIDVTEDSKVKGPLKHLALSALTLGTGVLIAKGTGNKFFYLMKDKKFAQRLFRKVGVAMRRISKKAANGAKMNETAGAARKYFFKGMDALSKKVANFASKGGKTIAAQGEKLTKATFNTLGAATGFFTTGVALSVDKDKNGRSDILEGNSKKDRQTQKAVLDFAQVVLDAM